MNALEIRGLKKAYPGFSLDIGELLLPEGCILGLVGENGAGKSTTLKLVLNMIRADAGSVTVLGRDNRDGFKETKEDIGVVLDEVGIPGLTAKQLGKVMAHAYKRWDAAGYDALLRRLNVPADKGFADLSRGNKMKVGIAVAMSHNARLLLLDEATNGLDPVARDEVSELLFDFTRDAGHSVLISSHIVSDLEKLCDYIAFLHGGRILLCEEKDVLASEYGLLHCPAVRLTELEPSAVLTRRMTGYGAEAIVRRDGVPAGTELSPVGIEDIFVGMVKGEQG